MALSVHPLVRPSVCNVFIKINEKWFLRILNDLDTASRKRKREDEEAGRWRKEGQGGRSDEEEGATKKVQKMKML